MTNDVGMWTNGKAEAAIAILPQLFTVCGGELITVRCQEKLQSVFACCQKAKAFDHLVQAQDPSRVVHCAVRRLLVETAHRESHEWYTLFLSCFGAKNITVYVHHLGKHLKLTLTQSGLSPSIHSQQGLERRVRRLVTLYHHERR